VKADFYYRTESVEMMNILSLQGDDFCTLAKGNSLIYHDVRTGVSTDIVNSVRTIPKGCCIKIISDQLSILIDLTNVIDIDIEIIKLNKGKEALALSISTLNKKMKADGYDKVPENVQIINSEKIASLDIELETIINAISAFELMK
jgi:valyl-tRNA synthetase